MGQNGRSAVSKLLLGLVGLVGLLALVALVDAPLGRTSPHFTAELADEADRSADRVELDDRAVDNVVEAVTDADHCGQPEFA